MRIRKIKTKIVAVATAGVVVLSLVAAGALNVVRRTFAASENFELGKSGDVEINPTSTEDPSVSVLLKAKKDGTITSMNGNFTDEIVVDGNLYFGLTGITASEKASPMVTGELTDEYFALSSDGGVEFSEGDLILTATYRVAPNTPVDTYTLGAAISAAMIDGTAFENESVDVDINVTRAKNVPDVYFSQEDAVIRYGNSLNNAALGTAGSVPVYGVEDTSVATIDSETGIVTGVGVGTTRVSATFAETETYEGVTIYYTLIVEPRVIGVESATVQDKMYDGGFDGEVSELSFVNLVEGDELTLGTDYTVEASFADVSVGTNVTAYVDVTLLDTEAASRYVMSDGGFMTTASILPFAFAENDPSVNDMTLVNGYEYTYTGEAIMPEIVVTAKLVDGDATLVEGRDYDTEYLADTEDGEPSEDDSELDVTNVGNKQVVVTGKGNYSGTITRLYAIKKADSGDPVELTAGLETVEGTQLGDIAGDRTNGFNWVDASTLVLKGENAYPATYVKNNDLRNYNTSEVSVPVYGLAKVNVEVGVADGGGAIYSDKATAIEGEDVTIMVEPDDGWFVLELLVNGVDRTDELDNNTLTITADKEDIDASVTFIKIYEVAEGGEQTVTIGEDSSVVFRIDADYSLFEYGGAVYIDDEYVDESNYTSESGSTIIKFNREYIEGLGAGTHLLGVTFTDGGVAVTEFTVREAEVGTPDTGVFTAEKGVIAGAIVLPVVLGALAGVYFVSRRKKIDFTK